MDLKSKIREVPDWPQPGVGFKDVTPLLADPAALDQTVEELAAGPSAKKPDLILGAEARGFILGAAIAREVGCGFVPARRPGKLPPETVSATYQLEYGTNALELHPDLIPRGSRVLIHDDVLATGGTVEAIAGLVEQLGGEVVGVCFIIELDVPERPRAAVEVRPARAHRRTRRRARAWTASGLPLYNVVRHVRRSAGRYTFACPTRGETHVALSAFRRLARLPGAAHPAVLPRRVRVRLRRASTSASSPTTTSTGRRSGSRGGTFLNLMTLDLRRDRATSSADARAQRIQAGEWPWSFFCYPEERPRPVFPSSFSLLAPGGGAIGLAVRCPVCSRVSVNLVSPAHVDLPFHNDRQVGVVEHVFDEDVLADARGVPRRAVLVGLRRPPALAGVTADAARAFPYRNRPEVIPHAHVQEAAC